MTQASGAKTGTQDTINGGSNATTLKYRKATGISDRKFDEEVADAIKADVRMFSGCQDIQTSADVHDVTKFGVPNAVIGAGGACTNALLVNVKDNKPDSWMSLLKGMRATLEAKNFKQIPQLATSKTVDIRSPFTLAGGEGGSHRALLIGINYVGNEAAELKGCHNDVQQMGEYITEHGYPAAGPDLKIVADDGVHEAPTKDNILAAIKWLVQGAKSGDSLFMHYSGHGGFVRDTDGDEVDKMDETMIPADFEESGQIRDDEIFAELVLPLPKGVVLSVVMDCCHSGSILDLPYAFDADDSSLKLVYAGGSGVLKKKSSFDMKKVHKAQAKVPHSPPDRLDPPPSTAAAAPPTTASKVRVPRISQDQATSPKLKEPHRNAAQNRSSPQGDAKFQLGIETQVLKCMETGGYVAPDPVAFKSFASCEGELEEDGKDDCDLSMFVITPDSVDEDSGYHRAAGISMLWVDSESSTGYSAKHITEGEPRFEDKRAVYIEAYKGEGKEAFLVAVFAPDDFSPAKKDGAAPKNTIFVVWVCDQLAHSRDRRPNWTACGSFVGTKVKKVSATTSPSGERLVVVEALNRNDKACVFYGTSLGNEDLQMSTFPKPRAMANSKQQVASVQASTLEQDGGVFAIAMSLPALSAGEVEDGNGVDVGRSMLFAQSLNDPDYFGGSIEIPGDTRCFVTAPADGLKTDVYVAGLKKVTWYDDKPWTKTQGKREDESGIELNEIDFTSPAKEMRTVLDKQYIRHVFILLESGKLFYTSQAPDDGNKFDEPVDILPSVETFSCHVDSIGNVHINNINKDGMLMHHMMDQDTGMWMQKEVMVPGGAAREHIISVVDLKVTAVKQKNGGKKTTLRDMAQAPPPLPSMSISCSSAAMVRINGKGHLMHKHKTVQVAPNMNGTVRIGQFVDSFSVPLVTVHMEGMDRPLEILCGKILHKKLENMDASDLKGAKLRDSMGDESGSLITDPDDLKHAESFMDSVHQLIEGFQVLAPTDYAKKNDVNGDFRLTGKALAAENQFVAFAGEDVVHDVEEIQGDGPSAGSADRSVKPVHTGVKEEKDTTKAFAQSRPVQISASSRPMVVRRFTKRRATPDPFGTGHLVIGRNRRLVECRSMGNFAKKARENADEAILKAKQQAAKALKVKAKNVERAQERANIYGREAAKRAAEAQSAMEAVRWTQAAAEAARVAADEAEKEEQALQDVEANGDMEPVGGGIDDQAVEAFEAASQAMQAAATAQEEAEEAKARMDELDDADVDNGAYGTDEYSSRKFGGRLKKAANSVKKAARKTADATKKPANETKKVAQQAAKKTTEAAKTAARKAEEEALVAKRVAERIAKEAKRKAEEAAAAAKREAEKAAKLAEEVAGEAKKATELAAKEVAEQAKKAAEVAKREAQKAAELAEKTANDVKDGVQDVADDVKDGVVGAANKVEEIAGNVKDEVVDAATDVADVVEDAAMKVVEVVEEVVEEVWEHTPDGLKMVARKAVKVVKWAVDVTVRIGKDVYHFVETAYEKLVMGLDWLWTKIKAGIRDVLDFLAELFGLREILKTAELMQASVVSGIDVILNTIPTEKDVRGIFNELRLSLEKLTGLDLDAEEMPDEEEQTEREVDPKENFVSHHAASGTFDNSVVEGEGATESGEAGVSKSGEDEGFFGKLSAAMSAFRETGSINALLSVLADGVLDVLEGAAVAAMRGLAVVGEAFRDWIAGGGVVYIPVISEMYKLVTGRKLKLGKAVFFMCSIPITYICRGVLRKWPSQLISHGELSANKDRTLTAARHKVSDSEFSSRGVQEEDTTGQVTDSQKNQWGVLSLGSIVFSSVAVVFDGQKSVADYVTGAKPEGLNWDLASIAQLGAISTVAKVCGLFLAFSAQTAIDNSPDSGFFGVYPAINVVVSVMGIAPAMIAVANQDKLNPALGLSATGSFGPTAMLPLFVELVAIIGGCKAILDGTDHRGKFAGSQLLLKGIAGLTIFGVNYAVGTKKLTGTIAIIASITAVYGVSFLVVSPMGIASVIIRWVAEDDEQSANDEQRSVFFMVSPYI